MYFYSYMYITTAGQRHTQQRRNNRTKQTKFNCVFYFLFTKNKKTLKNYTVENIKKNENKKTQLG